MSFRVLFLAFALTFAAFSSPFTSLNFFGDSLTDTGNVYRASSVLNRYTFGAIPKHPSAPYVGGRFTNGPVWAEHVATRLGRPDDARPGGMSMGWLGQVGGQGGNNYAVGGARTDSSGALGLLNYILPTGIFEQVDFYLEEKGGIADPTGLFFVFGAGNDLRDAARIADPYQRMMTAQQAGANIAYSVQKLYFAGARQFVLINSPDVGLIPETIGDGISAAGTDASLQFNSYLGLYGDYLRSVPEFQLQYFDLFTLHRQLVADYGYSAIQPCKSNPAICPETLFFDSVHPNAWVHEIVGNRIADQILSASSQSPLSISAQQLATEAQIPEPSSVIFTGSAAVLFLLLRRRRGNAERPDSTHGRANKSASTR